MKYEILKILLEDYDELIEEFVYQHNLMILKRIDEGIRKALNNN